MNQTNSLKLTSLDSVLNLYELNAEIIQKELCSLESKTTRIPEDIKRLAFYEQALEMLVESTFLQLYSRLEQVLYEACERKFIKKNASIGRFETALIEQGYNLDNEPWKALVNSSKIRNCLLHGNGRLDKDRYGVDTRQIIDALNSDTLLIETIPLESLGDGSAKIKIKEQFLYYCVSNAQQFFSISHNETIFS